MKGQADIWPSPSEVRRHRLFDRVMNSITDGDSSVGALEGSTEEEQFQDESTVESSSASASA